jgi:LPPG:FO 2-phospho-L-lactate transferase
MSPDARGAPPQAGPIVALCGGVGAARLLRGLVRAVPADRVVAIVNTGDDREFYGVHVSPDLDIVTYTLAGLVDTSLGYGLSGDTFALVDALEELGHETWFRLGDRDFAHCLHRTLRLREGDGLGRIADDLRRRHGLALRILPMAEAPCPTLVELDDGRSMHFEDYMIRERAPDAVVGVDLSAATRAKPAPGVLEAIAAARAIVVCPSNPVVSIGPILAVPGVREALVARRAPAVAISPIVGGAAVKGPARQLLRGLDIEVSALGVARHYAEWIDGFVIDERDRDLAPAVAALGLRVGVTDSLMVDAAASERVARAALELAGVTA